MIDDIIKRLRRDLELGSTAGGRVFSASPDNITALLDRLEAAERENEKLLKAIHEKGGTEHAPTQWAYDQACAALNRAKEENERLRRSQSRDVHYVCAQCGWTLSAEPPSDERREG